MEIINEDLYYKKEIIFFVEKNDRKEFLKWLIDNNCLWISNKKINLTKDKINSHVCVNENLIVSNVAIWALKNIKKEKDVKIVEFRKILKLIKKNKILIFNLIKY